MGYVPQKKQYNLAFEDFPGLEVIATAASLGEIDEIENAQGDPKRKMYVFETFISHLISWNVEAVEGQEVPPTMEGLRSLDMDFAMAIIAGWVTTVARASLPKGMNLNSGGNLTLSENAMRELERLQSPVKLPEPNFT